MDEFIVTVTFESSHSGCERNLTVTVTLKLRTGAPLIRRLPWSGQIYKRSLNL